MIEMISDTVAQSEDRDEGQQNSRIQRIRLFIVQQR